METLRRLTEEVENLWIEKETYKQFVVQYCLAMPGTAEAILEGSLKDPENRKEARERFVGMWEALRQYGTAAYLEDTLGAPPPTGKPN